MFNLLVSASLRSRLLVLAAAFVVVIYGSFVLARLPVDVFPDLNRPTVVLMTEAEGLAPQEVEQLVTYQIETAMSGMPGAVRVRYRSFTSNLAGKPRSTAPGSRWLSGWQRCRDACR